MRKCAQPSLSTFYFFKIYLYFLLVKPEEFLVFILKILILHEIYLSAMVSQKKRAKE